MGDKVLVTGAAGFIGAAVSAQLAVKGYDVVGIDNINHYYDPRLKLARLKHNGISLGTATIKELISPETAHSLEPVVYETFAPLIEVKSKIFDSLRFIRMDITDRENLPRLFEREAFDYVVNLAAQAGVRYSITNPWDYIDSNIVGFLSVLECCRHFPVKHLVYASSSSVYGMNSKAPFSEDDQVGKPVSLYATTKKSNEAMAYAYGKLYGIKSTGLRYFTVYGPWGRPDMAPMLFAEAISHGKPIKVFNHGDLMRDFTFIDDIVTGTIMTLEHLPVGDDNGVAASVYNIGCGHPVKLMDFIGEIEHYLGREATKDYLPMQAGDVYMTNADTSKLQQEIGYQPKVQLHEGIGMFIDWFKTYNKE
ncbi:MAG: NAD-dependent epimerase/dehydratase family protein [Muribaculaceae bacterium]|nr:NAD-dependent epimerase/dehydratase family protein [Muribaculaceae bacterium]